MAGSHENCVWCEQANFTDPSFHGVLDVIRKKGVEMFNSSKNKETVYNDIHTLYMNEIYNPIKAQETLMESRGIKIKNPVPEWTVESITHHFEKDEINPLKTIDKMSKISESIIDNIRYNVAKEVDPDTGNTEYTKDQIDLITKLSGNIARFQVMIFNMQRHQ